MSFFDYLSYPFVRYALIVGALISLCSALLGVTLVLRRMSFIGDGLSHVAFGAMAVAAVTGLTNNMLIVLLLTSVCAVLLLCFGKKLRGDAAIAVLSVSALAIGYLVMNLFPASSNVSGDVCSSLFGSASILTLNKADVLLSAILSVIIVVSFILLYNKIFAVTFDEDFAKASGIKVGRYNLIIAVMTAAVIVVAMQLVGSLLISALIVFPALCAMRVCRSFKAVTVCSVIVSVVCTLAGMVISIIFSTPVGPTIVCIDLISYIIFSMIKK